MGIQGKKVFLFLLFLTGTSALFGGTAISQEMNAEQSTPAETTKAISPPSLADLIDLAARLDNRFSALERDLAKRFDSTVIDEGLLRLNEKVDALSDRLKELKISKRYGYDQLAEVRGTLLTQSASLERIRAPVTRRIRMIELWSKEWSEEENRWKELQSSLAKGTSAATLRPTFAKARETIDKAQKLLASEIRPVLAGEQKGAATRARIDELLAEVNEYLRILRGDILQRSAPSMFSPEYRATFSRGLWEETKKGLGDISWAKLQFLQRDGLKFMLQVFLSLILIVFILRKRSLLAAQPRLRFLAERPFSAGIFAGFIMVLLLHDPPVGVWRVVPGIVISVSLVRLAGGLIKTAWRKRVFYVLVILFVFHELLQFLALPLPLYRGYVFLVALIGLCLCSWRALESPREGETRHYRWTLNLGATVSGVILSGTCTYTALMNSLAQS